MQSVSRDVPNMRRTLPDRQRQTAIRRNHTWPCAHCKSRYAEGRWIKHAISFHSQKEKAGEDV